MLPVLALAASLYVSCKKDDDDTSSAPLPVQPKPNYRDTLARKWEVKEATHNGSPDGSSQGLKLDIKKDGSYLLVNTGFNGTWKMLDSNAQRILIDDGTQYKTEWTVEKISSQELQVKFISPFTGGNSTWKMKPY